MGKVKDWLIEMQEDAACMTRDEWVDKHGESVIDVYNDLHKNRQGELFDVQTTPLSDT